MNNIYMEMPTLAGVQMPGIVAEGTVIPQDERNEHWQAYQTFLGDGGAPLPFDPTLRWDGAAYIGDTSLAKQHLDASRQQALQRVDDFHAETVQSLVGNPTQVEKDTWALKLEAAAAIADDKAVHVAGEQFLAAAGLDGAAARKSWAKAVLANAAAYAKVVGLAERLRDDARTAIRAASDEPEIAAVLELQRQAAGKAVASLKG